MANTYVRMGSPPGLQLVGAYVEPPPPPPDPDPPPTGQSYWTTAAPVTGGWQLDPTGPKRAGNRPGVALTAQGSQTVNTAGAVIENRHITGTLTINAPNVKVINCRFTSAGYVPHSSTGTTLYLLRSNAIDSTDVTDCEFYGAQSVSAFGGRHFLRCLFVEGNDQQRLTGPLTTLTECVFDGAMKTAPSSHSDCVQGTTPDAGKRYELNVYRTWGSVYNRFIADPDAQGNAFLQGGSWGSGSGIFGRLEDSFFDGGNYTFNGGTGLPDNPAMVFRRNRFGRNYKNGLISGAWQDKSSIDNTNVWADTLAPIPEAS